MNITDRTLARYNFLGERDGAEAAKQFLLDAAGRYWDYNVNNPPLEMFVGAAQANNYLYNSLMKSST
jgi:hypothetical protein